MGQDNASYLGSFYLPPADKSQLGELIRHYPTTLFIDVDAVLTQVMDIVQMIAKVISYLAILVMVAGLLVLLASLNLLMDERRTEVALLRVIGLSQRRIQRQYRPIDRRLYFKTSTRVMLCRGQRHDPLHFCSF